MKKVEHLPDDVAVVIEDGLLAVREREAEHGQLTAEELAYTDNVLDSSRIAS